MIRPLTPTQVLYVRYVVIGWEHGEPETLRSLLARVGSKSTNTASGHLTAASRKGYVKQSPQGQWLPTDKAIEEFGTRWVKRESVDELSKQWSELRAQGRTIVPIADALRSLDRLSRTEAP